MPTATLHLLVTIITTFSIIGFCMAAYLWSVKHNKIGFYSVAMMLLIMVQWMSDLGSSIIYHNYYLHLASVILFPSLIFCLFITYVFQGYQSVKQLLLILLVGEIWYVLVILVLYSLGNTPSFIALNSSWWGNHFYSTLALIIDYFFLIYAWPYIHNAKYEIPLFLKIWLVFWSILVIDSLIFTLGTFWNNPIVLQIISANIIIRTILATVLTPLIGLYLKQITANNNLKIAFRTWSEISASNLEQAQALHDTEESLNRLKVLEADLLQKNLDLESQRLALTNVLEDIQEEKNIVGSQADELRRFKAAAEQSNEMIVFTDPDGVVMWGNKATESITGFTVEEAAGKKAGVLWGKLMPKEWYTNLWKTIKIDKQIFTAEIKNHRKNGERFFSTITIYPLLDKDHNLQFLVATQRDITHEKEVDRMKTDFISLASHQLRTPLSAMKWFLEMLMAGDLGDLTKEQKEAVENVEQSNERMIALVNGLLNISRIESGRIIVDPVPTDIVGLISDLVKELEPKYTHKKQSLIISGNKKIPPIMLDGKLIREVCLNLLTNAIKYTGEGGEITIFISRKNQEVLIQITDSGYGIPLDEQERIFHRFFRASNVTKKETDGTGLGLYLAKAIVESSGGKIWFKSKEGEGTSFWFTLPMSGMQAKSGEVRLS